MERRQTRRQARRVQVQFWEPDESDRRGGYTINVSPTGLFIGTNRPLPPGTRVEVEIPVGDHEFTVGGTVVHAARVSPILQKIRPSGMGVKFDAAQGELSDALRAGGS